MTRARRAGNHLLALSALAVGLFVAFALTGYTDHELGSASTQPKAPAVGLPGAGPIVDLSSGTPRSTGPAGDEIALTFDDGPDPTWTPKVLAVLAKHRVPATFFVVGTQVLDHPELARAELAAGHEVGSHTFTHADLGSVPAWREKVELSLTESVLAGAIGRTTPLLRLPYSSGSDSLTAGQITAAREAASHGYLLVTTTTDPDDWRRPGVDAIVRDAVPEPGHGAIVLLHDGGGDRSQTVAALDRLIPELQARGYRFTTVGAMAHLTPAAAQPTVGTTARWRGDALLFGLAAGRLVVVVLTFLLIPIGILALARSILLLVLARRHRHQVPAPERRLEPRPVLVSVVIPAYNEAVGIAATVASVAASSHRWLEILVVDDGSTDGTAEIVERLGLPSTRVIRQPNLGKATALNAGIQAAAGDIVVMIDGDTIVDPELVATFVGRFRDPEVGGVSGNAKVGNRRGILGRWQHIEYVLGFNLDRRMYDELHCMPTVPGAAGAFRRQALLEVGGVGTETLAEDTDVTMAIIRAGWRVVYEPNAIAWTEAPATLAALWRQRYRWSYGTMQAMWKHRRSVREPGNLGRVAMPYMLCFQVLLPMLAPVIDIMAVYGLVFLNPTPVIAYWLGFSAMQLVIGAYAFRLDRERLRDLWALPLQQLVYRQLMYLVVIQSIITALGGTRLGWQKVRRVGLDAVDLPEALGATPR